MDPVTLNELELEAIARYVEKNWQRFVEECRNTMTEAEVIALVEKLGVV